MGGLVVLALLMLWILFGWWGTYSALNTANVDQQKLWGNVESAMQRRMDLIPNLVSTVRGYAKHESTVFTAVTEARAKVGKVDFGKAASDPKEMAKLKAAESELSGALSRLLVIAENYPQLKANEGFLQLQSQLEGTENRIAVARDRYNEGVGTYNKITTGLFSKVVASFHGFKPAEFFKADEKAKETPKVSFE
ncbi:MAG: LemA family protein [Candidatus Peribacteraceae bacterium]|nr:LemA family protein [Candidatus Peribacteraceae bacterium]